MRKRGTTSRVSPSPGDAADRGEPPAHACRLDGLPHHADVAGRLERVVGAEAARQVEDLLHRVRAAGEHVGRALPARELEPVGGEIDRDDALGALQPAARDRAEPDEPGAEDDARRAGCTFAVFIAAPRPVERPQAKTHAWSSGASGEIFASAISGITVYSANVDVPMKWRIGSPPAASRVVPSGR